MAFKFSRSFPVPYAVALMSVMAVVPLTFAQAAELAPRRMEIALSFQPLPSNPQFKGGSGRMVINLTGSRCAGYRVIRTTTAKLNFTGGTINLASEATINENGDGTQLAFALTDRVNGEIKRQDSVVARRTAEGIVLTSRQLPGGQLRLPKGVVLPMHHERLADAALAEGRKTLAVNMYNPEDTITSIDQISYTFGGQVNDALRKDHPVAQTMGASPRYRVEMLRKDKNGKFRVRENLVRFANGVFTTSDTRFDNMRIKANLVSVKLPRPTPCS